MGPKIPIYPRHYTALLLNGFSLSMECAECTQGAGRPAGKSAAAAAAANMLSGSWSVDRRGRTDLPRPIFGQNTKNAEGALAWRHVLDKISLALKKEAGSHQSQRISSTEPNNLRPFMKRAGRCMHGCDKPESCVCDPNRGEKVDVMTSSSSTFGHQIPMSFLYVAIVHIPNSS